MARQLQPNSSFTAHEATMGNVTFFICALESSSLVFNLYN